MEGDAIRRFLTIGLALGALAAGALAQVVQVVNTNDAGTGSLREALNQVNVGLANSVHFAIPGAAPYSIALATPLPKVNLPVTIDGTTQPGYAFGQTMVELDCTALGGTHYGLQVALSTVRGLHLRGSGVAGSTGILASGNCLVEACVVGACSTGVILFTGSTLRGSRIGTTPAGTVADGNNVGVLAFGFGSVIGGASAGDRNLISANATGVWITSDERVQGNWIGTDVTGAADLGNALGVYIDQQAGAQALVGTSAGEANWIAYSTFGVDIEGDPGQEVRRNTFSGGGTPIRIEAGQGHNESPPVLVASSATEAVGIATPGDTVELFLHGGDGACHDAVTYLGSAVADPGGVWTVAGLSLGPADGLLATATNPSTGTSAFSGCLAADECRVAVTDDAGVGSLRAAIERANLGSCGRVVFGIRGAGPHEIQLTNALPSILVPDVEVDGTTQPGYEPDTERVAISVDGTALHFAPGADGASVRGLHFRDVIRGVHLEQLVGATIEDNVFGIGEGVFADRSDQITVQGNRFGTDLAGQTGAGPLGQIRAGVHFLDANDGLIGGSSPGEGNQMCGNLFGIWLDGSCNSNVIQGNVIGLNATGDSAIANHLGVFCRGGDNLLGGSAPGQGNLVAGSTWIGAFVQGPNNRIHGNVFGLDAGGSNVLGNGFLYDVYLGGTQSELGGLNPGEGNVVAGGQGVVGVPFVAGLLGGPLTGGASSPSGPKRQVPPASTSAGFGNPIVKLSGSDLRVARTTIWGRSHKGPRIQVSVVNQNTVAPTGLVATASGVSGMAAPGDRVEVFRNDGDLDCLNAFEYLGFAVADGAGQWSLNTPLTSGDRVLATAKGVGLNTSPFSSCSAPVP